MQGLAGFAVLIARNDVRMADCSDDCLLSGAVAEGYRGTDDEVCEDRVIVGVLTSG